VAFRIEWSEEARADVRGLDKPTAMRIFDGVLRLARTGEGDVTELHGNLAGRLRLRVGDYRVIFSRPAETLRILNVKHRSEAYR
jgi:mRNA-degrading endonuclease RelE of RelBE toxin-antitoxin system